MTNDKFIKLCEKYAKESNLWLHPNNKKAVYPFYESFKKFCINELRNEDDENSVYDWLENNRKNPNVAIDDPRVNFIGHDPVDGYKIIVLGSMKDEIMPNVEIKRGNEKEIIEDVNSQTKKLLGYDTFFHEGGNHIEFRNKKDEVIYVIEWHFDPNYEKQNIVKKVCKELNITQRELAERIGMSADSLNVAVSQNKISKMAENSIKLILENESLKNELKKYETLKKALKDAIL